MNNIETAEHILKWCETPYKHGIFAWPTDACGYDQHIKFVNHRNSNWEGGSFEEWVEFVRAYARSLSKIEG